MRLGLGRGRNYVAKAPFGEELSASIGIRTADIGYGPDSVRQKFTGYVRDDETNLDFAQARYFSSVQGRFTSPDSFGGELIDPQTLNLYSYVKNNPLKYTDPTGNFIFGPTTPGEQWACRYLCDGGFLTKLKNWATDGGWTGDNKQAEKTRWDRQKKRARFFAEAWTKECKCPFDPSKYSDDQILKMFQNGSFSKTANDPMDPLQILGIVHVAAIVWTGPYDVSDFNDVTKRGATVANQELNANASQFEQKLQLNGYTKGAASDGSPQFTKGNETITIYSQARSTGNPSAQVKINDVVVAKIRLQP